MAWRMRGAAAVEYGLLLPMQWSTCDRREEATFFYYGPL